MLESSEFSTVANHHGPEDLLTRDPHVRADIGEDRGLHEEALLEVQGTAESGAFSRDLLDRQLDLATAGIAQLTSIQKEVLGERWPLDA